MSRPSASEDVFRAVADPTRRAVLEVLARHHHLTVTALARELRVSLPLLSRHLAVLRAAQLVTEHRSGRQRLYQLQPEPLRELYDWATVFADFWGDRLRSLRTYMERGQAPSTTDDPAAPAVTQGEDDHGS